jgi:hypothetical protein
MFHINKFYFVFSFFLQNKIIADGERNDEHHVKKNEITTGNHSTI